MKGPNRLKFSLFAVVIAVIGAAVIFTILRVDRFSEKEDRLPGGLAQNDRESGARGESFDSEASLTQRRDLLLTSDRTKAVAWVVKELKSGKDFSTGDDLQIGSDQALTTWPSFRVFLIDMLHRLEPETAAGLSRELLEGSDSPDEWAVALRNVAEADLNGAQAEWLKLKTVELLHNGEWKVSPSAGFLNAFDVIVYTDHTELSPELLDLCEDRSRSAIRHAAFLALDRLVQNSPERMLPMLSREAGQHPESGPMISNFMARADVRSEVEREALKLYLLDPNRTEEELRSFTSVFPNANYHISNNLLTENPMVTGDSLEARDRATLEIIKSWQNDPQFVRVQFWLQGVEARLENFVKK